MKRSTLITAIAGITLAASAALYAQSRDRFGRSSDRSFSDRSSSDRSGRSSRSSDSSAPQNPAGTQASTSPAPAAPNPEFTRPSQVLTGEFDILNHTSIFVKERRITNERPERVPRVEPTNSSPPAAKIPGIPVLVGVLLGDESYIAYLEDPDSGKLWPFAPGDVLPGDYGIVKDVTLDDIEIAREGSPTRRVPIGQNLKGEVAPVTYTSSATVSPTTAPAGPIDPNSPDLTFEQKMKLKRQREMGGG